MARKLAREKSANWPFGFLLSLCALSEEPIVEIWQGLHCSFHYREEDHAFGAAVIWQAWNQGKILGLSSATLISCQAKICLPLQTEIQPCKLLILDQIRPVIAASDGTL